MSRAYSALFKNLRNVFDVYIMSCTFAQLLYSYKYIEFKKLLLDARKEWNAYPKMRSPLTTNYNCLIGKLRPFYFFLN